MIASACRGEPSHLPLGETPTPTLRAPTGPAQAPPCPPPTSHAISLHAYEQSAPVTEMARMVRWQPLVWKAVKGNPEAFAQVMTFILVESGGRQFAVSRSGCAGLMQFCATTAMRRPFSRFFNIDALLPCACLHRRCGVHWRTRRLLETAAPGLRSLVAAEFPCAFSDPRFDPAQAIPAGWAYIRRLADVFEDNIYLIYIGYNSGPHVAERIWKRIGRRRARKLTQIAKVLPRALRPNFKRRARRRARALTRVHLPKVARVHQAYLEVALQRKPAMGQ